MIACLADEFDLHSIHRRTLGAQPFKQAGHAAVGNTTRNNDDLIILDPRSKDLGARIRIYDPYYKGSEVFGINVESNMEDAIPKVDASIIITAHKEFREVNPKIFTKMKTSILIDSRGIIDTSSAKVAGLVFRGLGRGI